MAQPNSNDAQSVKVAQQRAVLRFLSLYELLGDRLKTPAAIFSPDVDESTPLGLLRGLGWEAGLDGSEQSRAQVERIYALQATGNVEHADIVILHDGELLEATYDAMRESATLIVMRPVGGGPEAMLRSYDSVSHLLQQLKLLQGAELVQFRTIYRDHCIVVRKTGGSGSESGWEQATAEVGRRRKLAKWASKSALTGRLYALHQLQKAHPHGNKQASYKLWAVTRKKRLASKAASLRKNDQTVTHFGVHAPANAGDRVLFEAVRDAIDPGETQPWALRDVRAPVTRETIDQVNASRGMVIGGGGLFLVDLDSSSASGWQWPCPPELMEKIDVPISVFAVGYNRFRGQDEFPTRFVESLTMLVEKSAFIGIRNHGSIRALSEYLPGDLAAKLSYQPCPTTVMDYLQMGRGASAKPDPDQRVLVINTAFDRFAMRMAGVERETLGGIANMARTAQQKGWRVTVACHLFDDEAVLPFLDQAGVKYDVRHFTGVPTEDILRFYRSVDLVAGMRGHAQMIPFGVGTPILSLIAHDKIGWFLDDIGHPEWGADFRDKNFSDNLMEAFLHLSEDLPDIRMKVHKAKERLWTITSANVATIRQSLNLVNE